MNKKEVIAYLIQQRNLDWQYFDNTRRLNKERFETEVNKLKYELCMWRFLTGVVALFLLILILCVLSDLI